MYLISSCETHSVEIINNRIIKMIIIIVGMIHIFTKTQQFFTSEDFNSIELNPSYLPLST